MDAVRLSFTMNARAVAGLGAEGGLHLAVLRGLVGRHREGDHVLVVGGEGDAQVLEGQEDGGVDDLAHDGGGDAGFLAHGGAAALFGVETAEGVGSGGVLGAGDGLQDAVAGGPGLLGAEGKISAHLGEEAVEEVEDRGGASAVEGAGEAEVEAGGLDQAVEGVAAVAALAAVLVDLVGDEHGEEVGQVAVDVVGQGPAAEAAAELVQAARAGRGRPVGGEVAVDAQPAGTARAAAFEPGPDGAGYGGGQRVLA
jgi:hypothetical protein